MPSAADNPKALSGCKHCQFSDLFKFDRTSFRDNWTRNLIWESKSSAHLVRAFVIGKLLKDAGQLIPRLAGSAAIQIGSNGRF